VVPLITTFARILQLTNYTREIPSPKGACGVLGSASSRWEFGGRVQANTGKSFTPTISGDPLGMNRNDPIDFPDRVRGCNTSMGA
jgi:hypothetical protein